MKIRNSRAMMSASALLMCATMATSGCDDGEAVGSGNLTVLLDHGGAIFDGLQPGVSAMNIRDGWAASVDKYIVTVGALDMHYATDESMEMEAPEVLVVDLTEVPTTGFTLWTLEGLRAGRWEFNYSTPGAADGTTKHDSVAQADYDEMVANDWTYLIDGTLTKSDGQSCPPAALATPGTKTPNGNMSGPNPCYDAPSVKFVIGATAETNYGPCEVDEVPGFSIADGGTQTIAATIHGDHLFFNGFPEGDEGGVMRLAQWMADCDLNLDGIVTQEELKAIAPSQLPELDDRFQLGGSPITPLEDMYDFVVAQLKTQGHYQGEGECPVDGVAHDHGHAHDDHGDEHDHGHDH